MQFQRINRTDPEKVFVICKSAYTTATLTKGQVVIWAYNATDDGLAVTIGATATLALTAGVIGPDSIANGAYGLIQVYGHNADCLVTGATDVAVGDKLTLTNALFSVRDAASTTVAGESGLIIAGQAFTTTTAAAKKVFIRCMSLLALLHSIASMIDGVPGVLA